MAGFVYDSAYRPLAGATVEVVDGPQAGTSTVADNRGEFRLIGIFDDTTQFRATKDGHVPATRTRGARCAACNPNWWLRFNLATHAPPLNLAGNFTLTFVAANTCANLPPEAQTRTYATMITPVLNANYPADTVFELAVSGAPFLDSYKKFGIHVAGDYFAIELGDFHGDPGLVEQVAANSYLAFAGSAPMPVGTSPLSTISAAFDGSIDYCVTTAAMGGRYSCGPSDVVARAQCQATNHRLILTRQ